MAHETKQLTLRLRCGWQLPLPGTLPDGADVQQTISVIEDMNHDCKIHVEIADMMQAAESWGSYLAAVARAMVRDYSYYLGTQREDGDLFEAMRDGFNSDGPF